MKVFFIVSLYILPLFAQPAFAQGPNEDSFITILDHRWERYRLAAKKQESQTSRPARAMTASDKNFQRSAREQMTKGAVDPYETTVDARSAALEKNVQDSRTVQAKDTVGYNYIANVRNDSGRKIEVIFWEYRFIERAQPANSVRRQFLCAADMKPGDKKELSAFSLLKPSDVISADSLANPTGMTFDEKVLVNRIEYSDGSVLQRRDWKYADVRKGVERATATHWGKEVCRSI